MSIAIAHCICVTHIAHLWDDLRQGLQWNAKMYILPVCWLACMLHTQQRIIISNIIRMSSYNTFDPALALRCHRPLRQQSAHHPSKLKPEKFEQLQSTVVYKRCFSMTMAYKMFSTITASSSFSLVKMSVQLCSFAQLTYTFTW